MSYCGSRRVRRVIQTGWRVLLSGTYLRVYLVAGLVCFGLALGRLHADSSNPPPTDLQERTKLIKACTDAFREKARAEVRKGLEAERQDLGGVVTLDAAQQEKLTVLIDRLSEKLSGELSQVMARYFEPMESNRLEAYLRKAQGRPLPQDAVREEGARLLSTIDEDPPEWEGALGTILSPKQWQQWSAELKSRKDRAQDQEIEEFIRPRKWRVHDQVRQRLMRSVIEARSILALDDARFKGLEATREQVATKVADAWAEKEIKWLKALPENARSGYVFTQSGGSDGYVGYDIQAAEAAWKEALESQTSSEEGQRYEAGLALLSAKRVRCFARLFIAEKDVEVGLTFAQRQKLEPVVMSAFSKASWATAPDSDGPLVDLMRLHHEGQKTRAEDVAGILDPAQMERWDTRLFAPTVFGQESLQRRTSGPASAMSWRQNAIQMSLPEVLSNYLQEQYLIRRPVLAKAMQLRAFGVTHALTLDEASAHKLELAGLGAVEKSLDSYLRQAREAAEAALRDAQPDEIAPRLFSLGGVMIPPPVPEEQEVWKHALAELLSPDQRALWEKEVAERTRYDESAVVGLILLDVGEKYGISEAQETGLGPLILNAMHEMERRRPPRRHWYFSAAERLLPFLSIGEPELKEILTPDQWRDFEGHDAFNLRQRLDAQKRALDLLGKP